MTALASRADAWLRAACPAERLAAVRALVGAYATVYVLARFRYFADLSGLDRAAFAPVGAMHAWSGPPAAWLSWVFTAVALASSFALALGVRHRVTAPLAALSLLWIFSARSSWGKVLHTENLLVLHAAVLACAPAADAWSLDARRAAAPPEPASRYGWPLRAMSVVTALTYFVAGVAKLREGGLAWLSGAPLAEWLAWDAVRKAELGSMHSPLAPTLASHGTLTAALAAFTLAVELAAPFVLASPRAARAWALSAWGFHAGVLATMAIGFFYPLTFIAYVALFDVETIVSRVRARFSGRPR
ncbi:MAG: HTTM domain-containing protein [Myxococcales bacterium]|nr:HTTM domain-containing protein [Myxococcales bacterium]